MPNPENFRESKLLRTMRKKISKLPDHSMMAAQQYEKLFVYPARSLYVANHFFAFGTNLEVACP